jgi:hypothetical protein
MLEMHNHLSRIILHCRRPGGKSSQNGALRRSPKASGSGLLQALQLWLDNSPSKRGQSPNAHIIRPGLSAVNSGVCYISA